MTDDMDAMSCIADNLPHDGIPLHEFIAHALEITGQSADLAEILDALREFGYCPDDIVRRGRAH